MRVRILGSALKDLENGRAFYERQEPGIGGYFLDNLFADIDSLAVYAGIHRKAFGHFRLLSKRFPYAIYYKMRDKKTVVVHRVLDCRRDPERIRKALR